MLNYIALGLATFGVGYIRIAPGTWGSAVGVLIYFLFAKAEANALTYFMSRGWQDGQIIAWIHACNLVLFLLLCILGIWASSRAVKLFQNKDPQKVVVDEVIGQLITFLFVPCRLF